MYHFAVTWLSYMFITAYVKPDLSVLSGSSVYLGFLLPHAVDPWCQLDGGEWVGVVGRGVGDVGDHGRSAVDVAKGLPQQHCQFAVPGGGDAFTSL